MSVSEPEAEIIGQYMITEAFDMMMRSRYRISTVELPDAAIAWCPTIETARQTALVYEVAQRVRVLLPYLHQFDDLLPYVQRLDEMKEERDAAG